MFPRGVSTTRRVYVRVCALERRMSAHFWNEKDMSMRNFKHMTPCLSHNDMSLHTKRWELGLGLDL